MPFLLHRNDACTNFYYILVLGSGYSMEIILEAAKGLINAGKYKDFQIKFHYRL